MKITVDISEYVPRKRDPLVLYNSKTSKFHVSTTDAGDDGLYYDGHITMDEIVNLFIENYAYSSGKILSINAEPLLEDRIISERARHHC